MIPIGYCTLPEAVTRVGLAMMDRGLPTNPGIAKSGLDALILQMDLPVYVARESEADPTAYVGEIYRVPSEDMITLLETALMAGDIFLTGRAPKCTYGPHYNFKDNCEDWLQDNEAYASATPFDQEEIFRCLRRYSDARFVVRVDQLDDYADRMWPSLNRCPRSPIQHTYRAGGV